MKSWIWALRTTTEMIDTYGERSLREFLGEVVVREVVGLVSLVDKQVEMMCKSSSCVMSAGLNAKASNRLHPFSSGPRAGGFANCFSSSRSSLYVGKDLRLRL